MGYHPRRRLMERQTTRCSGRPGSLEIEPGRLSFKCARYSLRSDDCSVPVLMFTFPNRENRFDEPKVGIRL